MQFLFKKILEKNLPQELAQIGFDPSYIDFAKHKYEFETIKIYDLTIAQATILKQAALSSGCDCAINRHCLTFKIEKTDCILAGSLKQLKIICEKLKKQPFSLKKLAEALETELLNKNAVKHPLLMGILNITEDSFSDGGKFLNREFAMHHALNMIETGADLIDIGAESTRPGFKTIDDKTQIERLIPIICDLKKLNIMVSVDTRSSIVANEAVKAGADILNDVSGLDYDENIALVAAKTNTKLVLTHSSKPIKENIIDDTYFSLSSKIQKAANLGLEPKNLIIDVGIGFNKTKEQNYELIKKMGEFKSLGVPILAGVSRKSMFDWASPMPSERDNVSAMASFWLSKSGIDILRVHNIRLHKEAIELSKMLFD